jgi:hypothetical protein
MRHTLQFDADRLLLTSEQAVALEAMAGAYEAAADSLSAGAVTYLAGAVGREGSARITRRIRPAHEAGDALRTAYLRCMRTILSPDQWALLDAGWIRDAESAGDDVSALRIGCPAAAPDGQPRERPTP